MGENYKPLTLDDFTMFLNSQGISVTRPALNYLWDKHNGDLPFYGTVAAEKAKAEIQPRTNGKIQITMDNVPLINEAICSFLE